MSRVDQDMLVEAYCKVLNENPVSALKNAMRDFTNHKDQKFIDGVLSMGGNILRDIQNANGNEEVIKKIVRDTVGSTAGAKGVTTLPSHFVYDKVASDPYYIDLMLQVIRDHPETQEAIKDVGDRDAYTKPGYSV